MQQKVLRRYLSPRD